MVNKRNHPKMALFQVSELLRVAHIYNIYNNDNIIIVIIIVIIIMMIIIIVIYIYIHIYIPGTQMTIFFSKVLTHKIEG